MIVTDSRNSAHNLNATYTNQSQGLPAINTSYQQQMYQMAPDHQQHVSYHQPNIVSGHNQSNIFQSNDTLVLQ